MTSTRLPRSASLIAHSRPWSWSPRALQYHGYDGLREYFDSLTDVLPDWRPEVEMVEDHGDRMLVRARIYATPSGGSVPIEQVMWQVIEFRNARALRWDFFHTEEEARAGLGA